MHHLFIDFETYFDSDYTLKKMTTAQYVNDVRFKVHGAAVRWPWQNETMWLSEQELPLFLNTIPWDDTAVIAHNTYFDGMILARHYGVSPKYWWCTMSMARALMPYVKSYELDHLAKLAGHEGKTGAKILEELRGVHDPSAEQMQKLGSYAVGDVDALLAVFNVLYPEMPVDELEILSITLRWGIEPILIAEKQRVQIALQAAITEQRNKIEAGGVPKKVLASNPQFGALIQSFGIRLPYKISKQTKKETLALAKNDPEFIDIQVNYPEYAHIWEARKAVKSTLDITRAKRVLELIEVTNGKMPMPINYCGAHTTRWSGADKYNVQNWRRGGLLRAALTPPPGYRLIVADSSQIELRFNAWFCDELRTLDILRSGLDVYTDTASQAFNVEYQNVTKDQRFFGKTMELGLGYRMGVKRYRHYLASGPLGMDPIYISELEAADRVYTYRRTHPRIAAMWNTLGSILYSMTQRDCDHRIKCVTFEYERIALPNGLYLNYFDLDVNEDNDWTYVHKGHRRYIHGALTLENVIQAISRCALAYAMLQVQRTLGDPHLFQLASTTHDELIGVAPASAADDVLKLVLDTMSQPPPWAPDIPLEAEGWVTDRYDK